ncbi:SDR family oxidoreductase [Ahrensia marina]|uniref:SDR family oxidoreductase n=1 Tax=Ahrensia marina TaxID=1514904 RepID=UPI0035CF5185
MNESKAPHILVLGAYGLIGSGVCHHLLALGHTVTGLGRSEATAQRVLPHMPWRIRDLRALQTSEAWQPLLADVDIVINCAGTLQSGANNDTDHVQHRAIAAMAKACETTETKIIQISAVGAQDDASTAFMRTKAAGDKAVRATKTDSWILRPGLVLAPHAYGGTALIRMLAAVPLVQPLALAESPIQSVALADVCRAVALCIAGEIPPGTEADLVEQKSHTLAQIISAHRAWLGFQPARWTWTAPRWLVTATSKAADGLGRLGWRSALRSTAIVVLRDGVRGNSDQWVAAGSQELMGLQATLQSMPATSEHRLAARMALLFPIIIATLFVFWLSAGAIGLLQLDKAGLVLENAGWSARMAQASVIFWSLVDIALAFGILIRRFAKQICWLMVAVSLFYLLASTFVVLHLWLDPLGPLFKVLPAIVLALVARVLLETR